EVVLTYEATIGRYDSTSESAKQEGLTIASVLFPMTRELEDRPALFKKSIEVVGEPMREHLRRLETREKERRIGPILDRGGEGPSGDRPRSGPSESGRREGRGPRNRDRRPREG